MPIENCAICASSLRTEIEKRDIPGKVDGVIRWAKSNGVPISRFSLAKHRANHMNRADNDIKIEANLKPVPKENAGNNVCSDRIKVRSNCQDGILGDADKGISDDSSKITRPAIPPLAISDQLLLDTVRDMVYKKLVEGEIELKIDSAFKAIEIKQKISEGSQNEKLFLEILSEIRKEELTRENKTNLVSKSLAPVQ